ADFEQWRVQQSQLLEERLQQREKLIRQQGLSAFSHNLVEGESCPLCGSKEHPQPLSHHFDEDLLERNSGHIRQLKTELETIRIHQAALERESLQLEASGKNLDQKVQELADADAEKEKVIERLKSLKIINKEDLSSQLIAFEKAFEEQERVIGQLKKLRRDYQKEKDHFDQDEER